MRHYLSYRISSDSVSSTSRTFINSSRSRTRRVLGSKLSLTAYMRMVSISMFDIVVWNTVHWKDSSLPSHPSTSQLSAEIYLVVRLEVDNTITRNLRLIYSAGLGRKCGRLEAFARRDLLQLHCLSNSCGSRCSARCNSVRARTAARSCRTVHCAQGLCRLALHGQHVRV